MVKRLLLIVALGATLIACTPSGGSSPGTTVAPIGSDAAPSESLPSESASPSAS